MKRKVIWVVLSLMIAVCMVMISYAKVTPSNSKLGKPHHGGTIIIRQYWLNSTFDGYYFRPGDSMAWFETLFQHDWALDRKTWNFNVEYAPPKYNQGLLAESFEMPDPKTIIVHIRKGVRWQDKPPVNGREFTAYDVEHHFQRQLGIGGGYTKPSPMGPMLFSLFKNVIAKDNYTIVIELKKPSIIGLLQLTAAHPATYIEAPEAVKAEGGKLTDWKKAVGTGAWMLTDFVGGSSMTFSKNPDYWGYDERHPQNQLPYADTLKYVLIPDSATALAALRTGKVHIMTGIQWQQALSLEKTNPEMQMAQMPCNGFAVQMRCDNAPFTDIRVRKALQMSINREAIAKSCYGGRVAGTPVGQISPAYKGYFFPYNEWPRKLKEEYSYNPEKAKQLLAGAAQDGVFKPNKVGGFDTNIVVKNTDDIELLKAIKSYFMDIGVNMDIRTMDAPSMASYCQAGKNDQMALQNCSQVWTPIMLSSSYGSRNRITNYTHNNDPDHDALVDKFNSATTEDEAARCMIEIDRDALEKHWAVNVLPTVNYNIVQPYIKGYSGEYLWWNQWFYYARFWVDQDIKKSMGHK